MAPIQSNQPLDYTARQYFGAIKASPILAVIALLVVTVPCVWLDPYGHLLHGFRALLVELTAAAVLAMSVASPVRRGEPVAFRLVVFNPLFWLIALLAWAGASFFWSVSQRFSAQGLIGLGAGIMLCWAVANRARTRLDMLVVLDGLIFAALIGAVGGLYSVNAERLPEAVGVFQDHNLFGGFCTVVLPICAAVALAPLSMLRRYFAAGTAVLCASALIVSEARTSWIAEAVAVAIFALLWLRYRTKNAEVVAVRDRRRKRHRSRMSAFAQFAAYGAMIAGVLIVSFWFLWSSGALSTHSRYNNSLFERGNAITWRYNVWHGALKMAVEKPWAGRGIGTYPVSQQPYTGFGNDPASVKLNGPAIVDQAHNSYLQLLVEVGIPGVTLFLIAVAAAIVTGIRSLATLKAGGMRWWLTTGCVSAVIGEAVDAFSDPGWEFGDVSLYFWVALGLLQAATRARRKRTVGEPDKVDPIEQKAGAIPAGLRFPVAFGLCAWLMYQAVQHIRLLPAPHL